MNEYKESLVSIVIGCQKQDYRWRGQFPIESVSSVEGTENFVSAAKDIHLFAIAMAVTKAQYPFEIEDVNSAWEERCGFKGSEVVGRTFRFMQGAETDARTLSKLSTALEEGKHVEVHLQNYKKSGEVFANHLIAHPIYDQNGAVINFVGVFYDT